MKTPEDPGKIFNAYYFAHGCGRPYQRDEEWLRFFGAIADRIVSDIQPATVLDAGCAMGFLVEALRQRGVEAWGVDIAEYAIQNVHPAIQPYCWMASVTEPLPRTYDLIVCIEVLEHLPPGETVKAVENICQHTADVLFSSTPFDYKETTHFNVQPPEVWAQLFAQHSFYRDVDFDARFITDWAVRFRQANEPLHRVVRDYERLFTLLWKENSDLRALTAEMRDQLESNERSIQRLNADLHALLNSRSYRLAQTLQRVRSWLTRR